MYLPNITNFVTWNNTLLLLIGLVSYCVLVVIYRLYFHPLARFPGPKIAAATRLYEFHYDSTLHGRYWTKIAEMHERYGPIVRINPHEVHVSDPEFYYKIYNFDSNLDKDPLFVRELALKNNVQATVPFALHRRRRAAFGQFFSRMQITKLEGLIHVFVEKICKVMEERKGTGKAVSMNLIYRSFTAEVVCQYCFSKSYGFFENLEKARDVLVDLNRPGDVDIAPGLGVYHLGRFTDYYWILVGIQILIVKVTDLLGLGSKSGNGFVEFFSYSTDLINNVLNGKSVPTLLAAVPEAASHPTVFHKILDADLPPGDKDFETMFQNALLFLAAGFETTGFTLTLATYHLLANPAIHTRLRTELNAAIPDPTVIPPWADLEKLPVLSAVLKESLRLFGGTCSRLSRINYNAPIEYADWSIPPGTPVSMSAPSIHHNPTLFPDSDKFDPDRWLRAEDPKKLERFLVPFSKGSRNCIGEHLAMAEMYLALAMVFRRFEMEGVEMREEDVKGYYDEFISLPRTGKQRLDVRVL